MKLVVETYWRDTAENRHYGLAGQPTQNCRTVTPNGGGWESADALKAHRLEHRNRPFEIIANGYIVLGDAGTIQRVRVLAGDPGPLWSYEEVIAADYRLHSPEDPPELTAAENDAERGV